MQLMVNGSGQAKLPTTVPTEVSPTPHPSMDAELAQRMPDIARYVVVRFPALRRFDVLITRNGPQRRLEVTYAFAGSNVERLFRTDIEPPCATRELLQAFARLEADLNQHQTLSVPARPALPWRTVRHDRSHRGGPFFPPRRPDRGENPSRPKSDVGNPGLPVAVCPPN